MLKKEFESLTGKTVSDEDFTLINRIYMAAGEMDKATFCKNWKPEMLENPIVAALAVGAETWIKADLNTTEKLLKMKKDCEDAFRTAKGLQDQVNAREQKINQLRAAVDATVEHINLAAFPSLQEKFFGIFGKYQVLRMRHNGGWDLDKNDVEWLLDHCEDY